MYFVLIINLPCQFSIMQFFTAFGAIRIDKMAAILSKSQHVAVSGHPYPLIVPVSQGGA